METTRQYEVRTGNPWDPTTSRAPAAQQTFSVGVGEVVPEGRRKPAALYRVTGRVGDAERVHALAGRLARWLSSRHYGDSKWPGELVFANDRSARIVLTAAGREAGFLPVGRTRI